MGIISYIAHEIDEQDQVERVFVVTKFGITNRGALNRVAARAAAGTAAGQRTLVAAAYDEEGIDMVWREGPVSFVTPEEKWPDAQDIKYHSVEMKRSSNFLDITNIPERGIPRGNLADRLIEGIPIFDEESVMHVWEIPYEVR